MILSNLNLVYKSTIKIILFIILSIISTHTSAQNPVLEFAAGDGNPTGNQSTVSQSTTIKFLNNTDNPTGNSFNIYSNPDRLSVTFSLDNQQYTQTAFSGYNGSVFIGYTNEPI